jgi:hypothetical protein
MANKDVTDGHIKKDRANDAMIVTSPGANTARDHIGEGGPDCRSCSGIEINGVPWLAHEANRAPRDGKADTSQYHAHRP